MQCSICQSLQLKNLEPLLKYQVVQELPKSDSMDTVRYAVRYAVCSKYAVRRRCMQYAKRSCSHTVGDLVQIWVNWGHSGPLVQKRVIPTQWGTL